MGSEMCNEAHVNKDSLGSEPQDHLYQACDFKPELKEYILKNLSGSINLEKVKNAHNWMKRKEKDEYYLGQWRDHIRKGEGIQVVPFKYIYQGSFDGEKHGKGKVINNEHHITYEGEMVKGRINGQGKITHHQGEFQYEGKIFLGKPTNGKLTVNDPYTKEKKFIVTLQEYPEKKAFIDYADKRHYEGKINMKSFVPEGLGIMRFPNQNVYEGNWHEGKFHGEGIFTWPDGTEYNGQYKLGVKSGRGRLTYASKKVYFGGWVNGKQEGQGTLYDANGKELQKGTWKDGKFVKK